MDFVKININHKIVLGKTDYYSDSAKYPAPKEPEIWLIEDGNGAMLMFPDKTYSWISAPNYNILTVEPEEKPELTTKPNSSIIDSSTLLKAIAIAQQPELALNLLKE